jgi:hypothetical protein
MGRAGRHSVSCSEKSLSNYQCTVSRLSATLPQSDKGRVARDTPAIVKKGDWGFQLPTDGPLARLPRCKIDDWHMISPSGANQPRKKHLS